MMHQSGGYQEPAATPGRLLSAEQRRMLATLRLQAARAVRGLSAGAHRALGRGTSVEFREHRPYVAGDELRQLDWKLYGKTDRLFIKQYDDESDLQVMLLLDQSGSMAYPYNAASGKFSDEASSPMQPVAPRQFASSVSKHRFAQTMAASLATLCVQQQDRVGLLTFDSEVAAVVAPKSSRSHLAAVLGQLVRSRPSGETSLAAALTGVSKKMHHQRSTVVVLSDLFEDAAKLLKAASNIVAQGHELILVHVLHDDEIDFPFAELLRFENLETSGESRTVDAAAIATSYRTAAEAFSANIAAGCRDLRASYVPCRTSEDPIRILKAFCSRRRR